MTADMPRGSDRLQVVMNDDQHAHREGPPMLPADWTGIVIQLSGDDLTDLDAWCTNLDPALVPDILRQVAAGWSVPRRD